MKAKRVLALLLSVSMILPAQSFSICALASEGGVAVESGLLTEDAAAQSEADGAEGSLPQPVKAVMPQSSSAHPIPIPIFFMLIPPYLPQSPCGS